MRALFLDRDGVVNVNHGYVHRQENFDFIDGIFELARAACKHQYQIVVITNQAGIGRGYYTEADFQRLTAWMCAQFEMAGAPIARVYHSPYHPTEGVGTYRRDDFSRKPNPGMIIQAQRELGLNLASSVLVGDKLSDIMAGNAAGIGCNLLFTPSAEPHTEPRLHYHHIESLVDALPYLARLTQQGI